jgi:stage II sporulation protein GA (sporulation sigma-E factor processing peptidase)
VLTPVIFILIVPMLMVALTFTPLSIRNYIRILGYLYLLSFLLAGFHWGFDIINQRFFHREVTLWWRFIMHLGLILIMGELGWGIVHRKFWEQICLYPIQISWGEQIMKLNALLDTGNRLHDPITKVPVIIVELQQIKDLLPPELIKWVENIQVGELGLNIELTDFWEERVRVLPFNSLGKDHGLMVGFRSDQVKVWQKQQTIINKNVVIGLYNKSLSREGAFHALIPPAVLKD